MSIEDYKIWVSMIQLIKRKGAKRLWPFRGDKRSRLRRIAKMLSQTEFIKSVHEKIVHIGIRWRSAIKIVFATRSSDAPTHKRGDNLKEKKMLTTIKQRPKREEIFRTSNKEPWHIGNLTKLRSFMLDGLGKRTTPKDMIDRIRSLFTPKSGHKVKA